MLSLRAPFDNDQSIFLRHVGHEESATPISSPAIDHAPDHTFILPATFQGTISESTGLRPRGTVCLFTLNQGCQAFLKREVDVSRLNRLHKHLWLAGLERPARPLHHQVAIGRTIVVTESADLHLLWEGTRIYIKPLPEFLLCSVIWDQHLCRDVELHERASGLLLSYLWLIEHPSDWRLVHELGLLPEPVTWERWTPLARSLATHLDIQTLKGINVRYRYGELRLSRINWTMRLCSATRRLTNLFRGYRNGYTRYESFVERNLGWLVSATVYIGLVLTAMQVGLATDRLQHDTAFQRASYGITVFAILAPAAIVVAVLMFVMVLIVFNLAYTLRQRTDWPRTWDTSPKH